MAGGLAAISYFGARRLEREAAGIGGRQQGPTPLAGLGRRPEKYGDESRIERDESVTNSQQEVGELMANAVFM
jgi:hypothetical protein